MRIRHTVLLASIALAACGGRDDARTEASTGDVVPPAATTPDVPAATINELEVEEITLGKRVGTNNVIADATDDFGVRDTIVAVVKTDNAAPGQQLIARWTFGPNNQTVAEQTQTIAAAADRDESLTVFRLTKASAWPAGTYHLRIMNGAKELGNKDFDVR